MSCGNYTNKQTYELIKDRSVSCGRKCNQKYHGMSKTKTYKNWIGVLMRCYNKNNLEYHNYGGRGIIVCDEWKNSFSCFYNWCKNKYFENAQLNRINNDGNYEPDNCRFVTPKENNRNKRNNRLVDINGRGISVAEACEIFNSPINSNEVRRRLNKGWDVKNAFTLPYKSDIIEQNLSNKLA